MKILFSYDIYKYIERNLYQIVEGRPTMKSQ